MRSAFICILVIGLWCAGGCGAPGVPMPPSLALPRPVNDLAAVRKGGRVLLTWTEPTETTDRQNIRRQGDTLVCRAMGVFPMKECTVVKRLRPEDLHSISPLAGRRSRVMFEDALNARIRERNAIRHLYRRGPQPARKERGAFQSGAGLVGSGIACSLRSARRGHGPGGGSHLERARYAARCR